MKAAGIDKIKAADYLGWGCGMAFMVGRFAGTFLMKYIQPHRLLTAYAVINIILCVLDITTHGMLPVFVVIAIAFFMSIMFPTIFSLGIKDLGPDTELGSSMLVMSVAGGAALPPILGYISDVTGDIQLGYFVPLVCFVIVAWFGWRGYRVKMVGVK
jgi:FHS family L-fucose permease-like MFS transporter